jgi:branched-chain amino acid transport system substrate-binding protein
MHSRRSLLQSSAASAACLALGVRGASAGNAPGVTDSEIKFGQTMPYSGPLSAYGVMGRTEAAYFTMINEAGGIGGRKLTFLSIDDAFSPPKTVEQTRRLVEQEGVAFIFGALGGTTNVAIMPYLNENKIPQLFAAGGADMFTDPAKFSWSVGLNPANVTEAHVMIRKILATKPAAKIGVLYQHDQLGSNFLRGIHESLGEDHAGMLIKEVSYEPSEPTVDSQIITLQGAGIDTLIIIATPKGAAQAIRKSSDLGLTSDRYLFSGSASIVGTLKPAGLENAKGLLTARFIKDPSEARWKDDAGFKEWTAFAEKYLSATERVDSLASYGFNAAMLIVQVSKQCGDDLSRDNIMRQAMNIKDFAPPMMLPGVTINTSGDNRYPIRQMQFARFNGENWEMFGELLSD